MNRKIHSEKVSSRTWIRRILLTLLLLWSAVAHKAWAQQDAAFQQYWHLETQWNPAAVGQSPQLSINGAVQTHAAGFEQAGSTMWAGADIAFPFFGKQHGAGATFLNDAIGVFSHKRFALQYAYHHLLKNGTLSLGIQADMLQEGIDGGKIDLGTGSDPAFPAGQVSGSSFDLSVGATYKARQWQLAASYLHLTAPTISMGETHRFGIKSTLNISSLYKIHLNEPYYTIIPSIMLRSDFTDYRTDLTLRVQYEHEKHRLLGTINFAPGRSVGMMVGGTVHSVDICYGYEANIAGMGIGAGQHEIIIAYRLPVDLGKKGRNLHRSVRWL